MAARATGSIDQEQAILDAAYACLAERGYALVSMREIARRAEVALSQLHYYYQSKDGLFLHVMRRVVTSHLEDTRRHLAQSEGGVHEKVMAVVQSFRARLQSDPSLFRLLFDFTSLALWNARAREEILRLYQEFADLVETEVLSPRAGGSAQAVKGAASFSPRVVTRLLVAALFGTALQAMVTQDDVETAEMLEAAERMVLQTVGAPA